MNGILGRDCESEKSPASTELRAVLGFGMRAGSSSLRLALENLGLHPWHGSQVVGVSAAHEAIRHRSGKDLLHLTEELGFDVGLELHIWALNDILKLRPGLKVIALVRDRHRHAESIQFYIDTFQKPSALCRHFPVRQIPMIYDVCVQVVENVFRSMMANLTAYNCMTAKTCSSLSTEQHDEIVRWLDIQYQHVIDLVPPAQLLEFDIAADGYSELCDFFNVAPNKCPAGPLPRVNSRSEITTAYYLILAFLVVSNVLVLALAGLAAYGMYVLGFPARCCSRHSCLTSSTDRHHKTK